MIKAIQLIRHLLIIFVVFSVLVIFWMEPTNAISAISTNNIILNPVFEDETVGVEVESASIIEDEIEDKEGETEQVEEIQIQEKEEEVQQVEENQIQEKEEEITQVIQLESQIKEEGLQNLSRVWGESHSIQFQQQIVVKNKSGESAKDVIVELPMLVNNSDWEANYPQIKLEGRVGTFDLGEIEPDQEKILVVTYNVNIQMFSIDGESEKLNRAKELFESFPNSGNCLDLHTSLKIKLDEEGFQSRLVYGFAQQHLGNISQGSMKGARHSWLEIYVDDIEAWIPIDLNFNYFAEMQFASHITEGYDNLSTRVDFTGGELTATWDNLVL